jgi:hypothetical protein
LPAGPAYRRPLPVAGLYGLALLLVLLHALYRCVIRRFNVRE